ncbi:MAG TPA: hypothetical protein VG346_10080 [Acidimicrobiales bacterium]|nr:hypothetical protein [Acidimicrobiales bacterium]
MSAEGEKRAAGIAKVQDVHGLGVDPATIRRMTVGVLAALGKNDLLDLQFDCALERDELTVARLREVVVHLTHYVGWPMSTGMNQAAEHVIARRAKAAVGDKR